MVKTIKVSDTNWGSLEQIRKDLLKEKMEDQLEKGKLEKTGVTFDEVITNLLQKKQNQEGISDSDLRKIQELLTQKDKITWLLKALENGDIVHVRDPDLAKKLAASEKKDS